MCHVPAVSWNGVWPPGPSIAPRDASTGVLYIREHGPVGASPEEVGQPCSSDDGGSGRGRT
jgi:hypothetical protein